MSSVKNLKRQTLPFCQPPAWWKTTQTPLLTKLDAFKSSEAKTWKINVKFAHFVRFPLWWKTTRTTILKKLETFQSFEAAASNAWKGKLCPFCKPPAWWKNYLKTYFDKSRSFNKQKAEKMKKNCSNQVLEPIFSNQVLEIDVDSIEKFIHCSLQGGPFGGPACPPVAYYM